MVCVNAKFGPSTPNLKNSLPFPQSTRRQRFGATCGGFCHFQSVSPLVPAPALDGGRGFPTCNGRPRWQPVAKALKQPWLAPSQSIASDCPGLEDAMLPPSQPRLLSGDGNRSRIERGRPNHWTTAINSSRYMRCQRNTQSWPVTPGGRMPPCTTMAMSP